MSEWYEGPLGPQRDGAPGEILIGAAVCNRLNALESRLAVAVELAEALEGAAAATSVVRDFLYAGKVDRFAAEAATWAIHDAARKALSRWREVTP